MRIDVGASLRRLVAADSVETIVGGLAAQIAASRSIALVRVWLTSADADLELVASAGTPSGGGSYSRLDGGFREMAVSSHVLRRIATTLEPLVVRAIRGDEDWLLNPGWAARQGIRAFIALPLVSAGRAVGVLAALDRDPPGDALLVDLQLVADIAAARIADLQTRAARPSSALQASLSTAPPPSVVTRAELRAIERASIEAALARTNGKIFGSDGAAALLGMRPTTLASRIKALAIRSTRAQAP